MLPYVSDASTRPAIEAELRAGNGAGRSRVAAVVDCAEPLAGDLTFPRPKDVGQAEVEVSRCAASVSVSTAVHPTGRGPKSGLCAVGYLHAFLGIAEGESADRATEVVHLGAREGERPLGAVCHHGRLEPPQANVEKLVADVVEDQVRPLLLPGLRGAASRCIQPGGVDAEEPDVSLDIPAKVKKTPKWKFAELPRQACSRRRTEGILPDGAEVAPGLRCVLNLRGYN